LTREPSRVVHADLEPLRAQGLDDRAIVDLNQVVAYFNYVNRIAEGLGVELEPRWSQEARAHRSYRLPGATGGVPEAAADSVPWISVDVMREVDRLMVEDFGLDLSRMMENAGRGLAALAHSYLRGGAAGRRVVVLVGPGGNGGGGLVAARHLANAGAEVRVALGSPEDRLAPVTRQQLQLVAAMGIAIRDGLDETDEADLVIDALLGYGQTGTPRGGLAGLIGWSRGRQVIALDVPSGLDPTAGVLHEPHVAAAATLTLALPKEGLRAAPDAVGDLFLADISVPAMLYRRLGLAFASPFGAGPIVRLRAESHC
jgi:NAD(P)H-hydrate epimerase